MSKFTAITTQEIASDRNALLYTAIGCSRGNALHTDGSGLVTLRGISTQCFARYRVTFGGNIAIPAEGEAGEISIALAVGGEALASATATVTPAAVSEFWAVSLDDIIDVPRGCCVMLSVKNTSDQAIELRGGNLIIERVA